MVGPMVGPMVVWKAGNSVELLVAHLVAYLVE